MGEEGEMSDLQNEIVWFGGMIHSKRGHYSKEIIREKGKGNKEQRL